MRASHMPKACRVEYLEQIERRKMCIAAYAQENDLSAGSLYVWRGKLRETLSIERQRAFGARSEKVPGQANWPT